MKTPLKPPSTILGVDLSLNHAAFVQLRDGVLDKYLIVTPTKSIAATSSQAVLMPEFPGDHEDRALGRLSWWRSFLDGIMGREFSPDYVAIEDYAYGAKQGAHQTGEVGGLLRLELWRSRVAWRKYSPSALKKFAAHRGRAEKDQMVDAVRSRWGADFTHLRPGKSKMWLSAEDAADAFAAAKLLDTEVRLRSGALHLSLLHTSEIEVFNAVGKGDGNNLLARDFIRRG